MTDELKHCPFCGGKSNIAKGQIEFWAYCPHCGARTEFYETEQEAVAAWNRRNETELVNKFLINNDKNLIVKFERSEPNARMSFPIGISYDFDNIRDLNDVEKEVLSKLLTDVKKEICDDVHYESSSYSCRACESAHHEREKELSEKIDNLEAENLRLREALELIAKSKFYFARGEEDKQLRRVCEIAKDCLKGIAK